MSRHRNCHATRPGKPIKHADITPRLLAIANEDDVDGYAMAVVEGCRFRRAVSLARIFHDDYGAKIAIHVDVPI